MSTHITIIALFAIAFAVIALPGIIDRHSGCRVSLEMPSVTEAHDIMQRHREHDCD